MTLRARGTLWLGTIALAIACGPCWAGDLPGQNRYWPIASPQASDSPRHYVTSPPGADFYPQYTPYVYPPYVRPTGAPSYSYGYFGARYQPQHVSHVGYNGDFMQWTTPRGF